MDRRRIVVVEDDPMTRGMLGDILEQAGFAVATASTASDARRVCALTDPDGVVMDIDLGIGPTGFDVADALLKRWPHLAVLFLTNLPDSRFAGRDPKTLPAGVAYLRKERLVQPGLLAETLDQVLRGQAGTRLRDDQDPQRPLARLSQTQVAVLRMVALGLTNQQIADRRGTSVRAVQDVITRALGVIGADADAEGSMRVRAARQYMLAAGIPLAEA